MVKITMLESSGIGSSFYRKGETYEVEEAIAYALGPSCTIEGKAPKVAKAPKAPAKDKMVKAPKVAKAIEVEEATEGTDDAEEKSDEVHE